MRIFDGGGPPPGLPLSLRYRRLGGQGCRPHRSTRRRRPWSGGTTRHRRDLSEGCCHGSHRGDRLRRGAAPRRRRARRRRPGPDPRQGRDPPGPGRHRGHDDHPARPRRARRDVRGGRRGLQLRDPRARRRQCLAAGGLAGQRPAPHRRRTPGAWPPPGTPGCVASCRRACRSSTPTRATTGSARTRRSRSPAPPSRPRWGRAHVQDYVCESRAGVVLRLGTIIGDDPMTRFQLRALRQGHPIGLGSPEGLGARRAHR